MCIFISSSLSLWFSSMNEGDNFCLNDLFDGFVDERSRLNIISEVMKLNETKFPVKSLFEALLISPERNYDFIITHLDEILKFFPVLFSTNSFFDMNYLHKIQHEYLQLLNDLKSIRDERSISNSNYTTYLNAVVNYKSWSLFDKLLNDRFEKIVLVKATF